MELPKNITQIGESDRSCKIYVEDYVISYIKQMNHLAENKEMAVALYGIRREENQVSYIFLYGACKLDYLNREVRHLSQAQNHEIEQLRKKYFPEYEFQGYRLLNGEMVEGIHICEQGICRYIKGYACFYEKNDSMLAYMIESRGTEVKPEEVPQEKYEEVRKRQEQRRMLQEEAQGNLRERRRTENQESFRGGSWSGSRGEYRRREGRREQGERLVQKERWQQVERPAQGESWEQGERPIQEERWEQGERPIQEERWQQEGHPGQEEHWQRGKRQANAEETGSIVATRGLRAMRAGVAGMFVLLCVLGLAALSGEGQIENLQVAARQFFSEFTEQKLPDADSAVEAMGSRGQTDTLVAEDKLTQVIQQENAATQVQQTNGSDVTGVQNAGTQGNGTQGAENQGAGSQNSGSAEVLNNENQGIEVQSSGNQNAVAQSGESRNTGTQNSENQSTVAQSSGNQSTGAQNSENQSTVAQSSGNQSTGTQNSESQGAGTQSGEAGAAVTQEAAVNSVGTEAASGEMVSQTSASPSEYVIQEGDTLIGICIRQYGSDARIQEICNLNNITNPDNIKIGQKILLP